jgi:hypothetical protein
MHIAIYDIKTIIAVIIFLQPSLTFKISTFCPHSVFMCFVWISEQTAIISLYSINWFVCITETECVYCAVRTESLYIIQVNFRILMNMARWLSLSHFEHIHCSERAVCNRNREAVSRCVVCCFVWLAGRDGQQISPCKVCLIFPYVCSISTKVWNRDFVVMRSIFCVVHNLLVYVERVQWVRTCGLLTPGGGGAARLFEGPLEFAQLRRKASQRLVSSVIKFDVVHAAVLSQSVKQHYIYAVQHTYS